MKKFLRSLLLFAALGSYISTYAQQTGACGISDIVVFNVRPNGTSATGSCSIFFDVSFTLSANNGNKYIFAHSWIQSQYPNYFNCQNGVPPNGAAHAPHASDLAAAFLNLGFQNNSGTLSLLSSYLPDPTVTLNTVGSIDQFTLPNGDYRITLRNVQTTVPVTCGTPVIIATDIWATNAANGNVVQCVSCGVLFSSGYLTTRGTVNCTTRQYTITVTNNTSNPITANFTVYSDVNNNQALTTVAQGGSDIALQNGSFTVAGGATYTITGTLPDSLVGRGLFVQILQTTGTGDAVSNVTYIAAPDCIILPVSLRSFTVNRANQNNISLRWETATEVNNNGFFIQRNMGGTWETLGFIPSQANGGNSNSVLTYTFTDFNNSKGVTQYRLRQVDMDGKAKYSEIKTIRGLGQMSKTIIYPNPSNTGSVRVVFEDVTSMRDVFLSDMSGRVVKQWKALSNNNLQIDNLMPGVYTLRIVDTQSGEQATEKVVVNTR